MKIAFITREFSPLSRQGGIGAAMRHLYAWLSHAGYSIEVYYTGRPSFVLPSLIKTAKKNGIQINYATSLCGIALRNADLRSRKTFHILRSTHYDIYLFHDFMADAFHCLQGKSCCKTLRDAKIGIVAHGSAQWVDEGNGQTATAGKRATLYAMERFCCESADFLVSPSQYLVDWMQERDWKLPVQTQIIPNFFSDPDDKTHQHSVSIKRSINEVVFFGRLEERKGIRLFCESILRLPSPLLSGKTITFLGKETHLNEYNIKQILSPLHNMKVTLKFLKDLNSHSALDYLCDASRIAVMPSLRENSPCAVGECLERGIPFIASSIGGGPELVVAEDREKNFFVPQVTALYKRLVEILDSGLAPIARPAYNNNILLQNWKKLLNSLASQ